MTNPDLIAALAATRRAVTAFNLPLSLAEVPLSRAYAVQDAYAAAVAQEAGGIAGYKLGANSPTLMAHFGIPEPVSGRLFGDEIYATGAALPRDRFHSINIELELAAVLGPAAADTDAPIDLAGAEALIECYRPAIEILDLRGKILPKEPLSNTVAINVYSAGCVLGAERALPGELDIDALEVSLLLDGAVSATVTGTAPQPPAEAVMWLVNDLNARSIPVAPGMIVICGSFIPIRALEPGISEVAVDMKGFGSAAFSLTG